MLYHRILVAFDGSEASEKALNHAVGLAEKSPGCWLVAAHVLHRPILTAEAFGWSVPDAYAEQIRVYEDSLVHKAQERIAGLPYAEVAVLMGNPAVAILEFANEKNCDLIVMGSRGLGAIKEWMLGSVSHHVVQQARVPVLIVK